MEARSRFPQLLVPLVALAEIANHSRKTLQFSVFIFERHGDDVGPKSRFVLFQTPAFVPEMALCRGPCQFLAQPDGKRVFGRIEQSHMLAHGLLRSVAVKPFGS